MKKTNVQDLAGAALDWAVAQCENALWIAYDEALENDQPRPARPSEFLRDYEFGPSFSPSTDWAQGGPIIQRERIWIAECSGAWSAKPALNFDKVERPETWASTPLIAAMRCFVASQKGPIIEVPEVLL